MINQEFAERFAQEWIDAWNSPDLHRVLSHYADDFECLLWSSSRLPVTSTWPILVQQARTQEQALASGRISFVRLEADYGD